MEREKERAWAEIDLAAAGRNFETVRAAAGVPVIAVVKANAYGHGATCMGRLFAALGAARLAVATLGEAEELRRGGVECPIQILGWTPPTPENATALSHLGAVQTLCSPRYGRSLLAAARQAGVAVGADVKVDTGMGRLGFLPQEAPLVAPLFRGGHLVPRGIFTHFYAAEDEAATRSQCRLFEEFRARLWREGLSFPLAHASSSFALPYDFARLDAVRAGLSLYGYGSLTGLSPVLVLRARCVMLKWVEKGATLSYGGTRASRPMRVATLSAGYGDGFSPPRGFAVSAGGALCPVLGRVCMDMTLADATAAPLREGDAVTLWDGSLSKTMKTEEIYRLLTGITARVPRILSGGGSRGNTEINGKTDEKGKDAP